MSRRFRLHRSVLVAGIAGAVFVSGVFSYAWQGAAPAPGAGRTGQNPPAGRGGRTAGGSQDTAPQRRKPAAIQDAQNAPAALGTGSISGLVAVGDAGTPLARASVTLSGGGLRGARASVTTDRGRFSFAGLPAGRFDLHVSKPGYVGIAYGAKKPGRPGTPIQLAEGQALDNISVSLPKGSVVTGVVVDDHGEPSLHTLVRAFRYVLQNGARGLQQAGQSETDDRGIYRIFELQPGDYLLSASPRSQSLSDVRQQIQTQLQPLLQQLQPAVGRGNGAAALSGRPGGGGQGLGKLGKVLAGGGNQKVQDQIQQLQQQVEPLAGEQTVAYAPIYYPGTTTPATATKVVLGVGEERGSVDFQLQLVPTAKVQGTVIGVDSSLPQIAQISLLPADQQDSLSVPGAGTSVARIDAGGKFAIQHVTPGQYRLLVRAPVGGTDSAAAKMKDARAAGLGARVARGAVSQMLWAAADITVDGHDLSDLSLNLQPGMTVSGRVAFDGTTAQAPADFTTIRVNLQPVEPQNASGGAPVVSQVDASGQFTIIGVAPGVYSLRANAGGGGRAAQAGVAGAARDGVGAAGAGGRGGATGWTLKSVIVNGRDVLDFPLEVAPNDNVSGAVITFTDRAQSVSGSLQDAMGRPTADNTVIIFSTDNRYWTPQSRRIKATRPGTDGRFSFVGLPAGQYRLAAVTDAEQGEWLDPGFLTQLVGASITLTLVEGEKKTQDIRLAGGG